MKLAALAGASLALFPMAAAAERLEMFNNRLFVPVLLDGRPATALLDSGAEMNLIDDDLAASLQLEAAGSATARGSGAETMEARFIDRLPIEAAGIRLDQTAAVLDLDEVSNRLLGRPVQLIVGRPLFDSGRIRIDMVQGVIERAESGSEPRGTRLPVGEDRGLPTIPASVEGHAPVAAIFDLGNGSDVMIGRAYADRIGLSAPDRRLGRRTGGGLGGAVERDLVTLESLEIAGRSFRDVEAVIDDGESAADLNVGTALLRHFRIVADFPNKAVWLDPIEPDATAIHQPVKGSRQ